MAKIGLIFTTDYEIFGNGTGCVSKCMIEPTERMATLLEDVGATLTVFVDVCEYWAFESEFRKGNLKKDWAGMIRRQLRDLLERGHDVQLHFHPQWLDYSFDGKTWELNYDLWRIGSLKYEDTEHPERGLKNLFAKGKQTLEEMLRPVKPHYKCEIFRAGAWSIQPEEEVLRAMGDNGFRMDSSVAPGLWFRDEHTFYDFRKAPEGRFSYPISSKINEPDPEGYILEVPIFTAGISIWQKLKFLALRRQIPMKPIGCEGLAMASAAKSKSTKLRELLLQNKGMFTFGDAVSAQEMNYYLNAALKKRGETSNKVVPIVAISHPKTFANEKALKKFLQSCGAKEDVVFSRFQQFIKQMQR